MMECYIARRQKGYPFLTVISDSFNRANGNLGNADTGQAWLSGGAPTTSYAVSSNSAYRTSATDTVGSVAYIDGGKKDCIVSSDFTISDWCNRHVLVARMIGETIENAILFTFFVGGTIKISKVISGVETTLATAEHSYVSGTTYSCSLSCIGNDFTATVNGETVLSATDDNALKNNTITGMFIGMTSGANLTFDKADNFLVRG